MSSMAGCLWFAAVFFGFCAIILNRSSDISGYDCRCQPSPAFELVSRQWSSYLSKEKMFFGIDMALTRWSSGFCMQKIALPSLKQKMFNDPFVVNLLNLSLDTIQMIMTLSTSSLILALLLKDRTPFNQKLFLHRFVSLLVKLRDLIITCSLTIHVVLNMLILLTWSLYHESRVYCRLCVPHQRIYIFVYSTLDQSETKPCWWWYRYTCDDWDMASSWHGWLCWNWYLMSYRI